MSGPSFATQLLEDELAHQAALVARLQQVESQLERPRHVVGVRGGSIVEFRLPAREAEIAAQKVADMLGVIVVVKRDGHLSLHGPSPVDDVSHSERGTREQDRDSRADHEHGHRVCGEKVVHPDQDGGPLSGGLLDRLTDLARTLFIEPKRGPAVVQAIRKFLVGHASPSSVVGTPSVGVEVASGAGSVPDAAAGDGSVSA